MTVQYLITTRELSMERLARYKLTERSGVTFPAFDQVVLTHERMGRLIALCESISLHSVAQQIKQVRAGKVKAKIELWSRHAESWLYGECSPLFVLTINAQLPYSFWVHPRYDDLVINHQLQWRGRFYGYPEECIEAFCNASAHVHQGDLAPIRLLQGYSKGYPCIVSSAYAHKHTSAETLAFIAKDRIYTQPYGTDQEQGVLDDFEYFTAMQLGELQSPRHLRDRFSMLSHQQEKQS